MTNHSFKLKLKKIEEDQEKEKIENQTNKNEQKWLKTEGELSVDIYQTETKLIIQSAIAGIKPEDLDITIEKDVMIIRGNRRNPLVSQEKKDYFTQECYWGLFSRKIIFPVEVNSNEIEASIKDGILIIQLSKILQEKRKIEAKEI